MVVAYLSMAVAPLLSKKKYGLIKYNYHMLIARMEPENNVETILDGVAISDSKDTFLVVGDSYSKDCMPHKRYCKNLESVILLFLLFVLYF